MPAQIWTQRSQDTGKCSRTTLSRLGPRPKPMPVHPFGVSRVSMVGIRVMARFFDFELAFGYCWNLIILQRLFVCAFI